MKITEEEFDTLVDHNCAGLCDCDECKRIKEKQESTDSQDGKVTDCKSVNAGVRFSLRAPRLG